MITFLVSICLILLVLLIYLLTRLHKIEFIRNINNKFSSWLIPFLVIIIIIVISIFFGLKVVVYFLHLTIFYFFAELILLLIKKLFRKEFKYYYVSLIVLLITSLYIGYAWINANNIVLTEYKINSKKVDEQIKIVFMADSHIGTSIDGNGIEEYIDKISDLNPDVVLLLGDITDESTKKDDMLNFYKNIAKVKTKYGIYMVFGNHDLNTYGGNKNYTSEELISIINQSNIKLLRDESTLINDKFYLVGRNDATVYNRKTIESLTENLDKNKYIVVMDHQPVDYKKNEKAGSDLLLSGHTHGGQMIPLSLIGELVSNNEQTYGIKSINNTNYIVTSGLSGWEIPYKTGAKSEYVLISVD